MVYDLVDTWKKDAADTKPSRRSEFERWSEVADTLDDVQLTIRAFGITLVSSALLLGSCLRI